MERRRCAGPSRRSGAIAQRVDEQAIAASLNGGIAETRETLILCAEKGIASGIELTPIRDIGRAYHRMPKRDVKHRFLIDVASLA